jgi:hypothetical protein
MKFKRARAKWQTGLIIGTRNFQVAIGRRAAKTLMVYSSVNTRVLGLLFSKSRRRSAAMKIRNQILRVVLSVPLLMCFDAASGAQQVTEQELPTLSPPLHPSLYPEVMCAGCVAPRWDHGYLVHVEFDKDPAVVTMYDRVGKKVLQARMEPPGATKVSILSAGATQTAGTSLSAEVP